MAGASRKERYFLRLYLTEKYGNRCAACGRIPKPGEVLDVDHINGNPADDSLGNHRLLCRSCNTSAGIRRVQGIVSYLEREGERPQSIDPTSALKAKVNYSAGSPEMQVNEEAETRFRNFAIAECLRNGTAPMEDLIASGAELGGGSINAARNYLKKMVSSAGPLEKSRLGGKGPTFVRIKPQFREAIASGSISPTEAAAGVLKESPNPAE